MIKSSKEQVQVYQMLTSVYLVGEVEQFISMYNEVKERYTIELVPEVKYIGIKSKEEEEIWNTLLNKK